MSNMPDVTKRKVSLQIPIKTILKMDNMAAASGLSRNEVAAAILDRGTAHIALTDEAETQERTFGGLVAQGFQ